jgi:predicted ATPase with chaperone activity
MVTKSQKRISGPMLDHMDIHIKVPRVDYEKLSSCAKLQHGVAEVCQPQVQIG